MQSVIEAVRRINWRRRPQVVWHDYRASYMRSYGFPIVHWSSGDGGATLFIGCMSVAFTLQPAWR